jgi:hypothetical protein
VFEPEQATQPIPPLPPQSLRNAEQVPPPASKITTIKLEEEELFAMFASLENDVQRKQFVDLNRILSEGSKKQELYMSIQPIIQKKINEMNSELEQQGE